MRKCVACGQHSPREELIRMVRTPAGSIVADWRRNLSGRGAHVCSKRPCIERAVDRRMFNRALRDGLQYPPKEQLLDSMRTALERQWATIVRSGLAAKLIEPGVQFAMQAIHHGKARYLVVAQDSTSLTRITTLAADRDIPVGVVDSKDRLGAIAGRTTTGVLTVLSDQLAKRLLRAHIRMNDLD